MYKWFVNKKCNNCFLEIVPDRRRFGHGNVVCGNSIRMWGQEGVERGQWRLGKGAESEAVDSEQAPFQVRGLFLILNINKYDTCDNT